MLCGGVNKYKTPDGGFYLGGLDLLDLTAQTAVHQIPVALWLESGIVMTHNPYYVEIHNDNLRFYFAPEDNDTTLYVYDALR